MSAASVPHSEHDPDPGQEQISRYDTIYRVPSLWTFWIRIAAIILSSTNTQKAEVGLRPYVERGSPQRLQSELGIK